MELTKVSIVLGLVWVSFALGYEVRYQTGCQSAGLCCEQVNNTCYVPNSRKIDGNIGNCFCDSKCLQMKDCCVDFEDACNGKFKRYISARI